MQSNEPRRDQTLIVETASILFNCSVRAAAEAIMPRTLLRRDCVASLHRYVYPCECMRQKKTDALHFFQRLGEFVENTWREKNYDVTVFPKIAAAALAKHSPFRHVESFDLVRHVAANRALPTQWDIEGEFSNLPITLFNGPRFYIDIYFWLDGTTTIHQHSFAGAFQVLSGSSLHSHYEFVPTETVNPHFVIGNLSLRKAQVLACGDVKEIVPGRSYIHSLFHLDRPSATITIRTPGLPTAQPQFSYLRPGIAFDPSFREPTFHKKVQSADLLLRMRHPEADSIITQMIFQSDLHTVFMLLDSAFHHYHRDSIEQHLGLSSDAERFETLQHAARSKHGKRVDTFFEAFVEAQRKGKLVARRSYVTDEELRFFLALLLNVSGRKRILSLVRQRFPEERTMEKALNWIEDLSRIRLLDASQSNALEIESFDDLHLIVIECLLRERTLEQTQRHVREVFGKGEVRELTRQTEENYHSLKTNSILAPLFVE